MLLRATIVIKQTILNGNRSKSTALLQIFKIKRHVVWLQKISIAPSWKVFFVCNPTLPWNFQLNFPLKM